jgi:outer membrane protein assembly factor BamE (lipoprotein component of BamABCDE complex)
MKLMRSIAILLALGLMLQGCIVSRWRIGNPIAEESLQQIQKGTTDRDQLVALLGAPDRIIQGSDKEIFQYYYYDGKSPALFLGLLNIITFNVKSDNLYVFLDKGGIVQDIVFGKRTDTVEFTLRPWGK